MKARKDHLKIAKPKEPAPKTRATARRTDSKTCLTPQERGKGSTQPSMCKAGPSRKRQGSTQPAKSMKKLKNSPWNAAPPHYATLPQCVHTQRLDLHNSPNSPPCWQSTHQGTSPCLDAPPWNMPWSAMHACLKSFQVQNKSICKGRNSTAYEGAYTKTMHGETHKNISIQIMSKHLSFVKEKASP